MTNIIKAYRHGEIAFVYIKKLPTKLKKSNSKIIVQGSHGNAHSFYNGELYFKQDGYILGYFKAKNTTLLHSEHGVGKNIKKAKLPDGVYEIRKQLEFTPSGLIPVID